MLGRPQTNFLCNRYRPDDMIKLYNTRTKVKEEFTPLDPENVRMYVCGPTVYDRAHLGNARPVVVFDVLYRLLRHTYGEDAVTYVRNFTDVDDKINARAAETGRTIREITDETIGWYHDDMDALGTLRPTHEPRATEYIEQMKAMIAELIAKGCAYEAEGHVLFAVDEYKNYGQLSGRSIDDMIAGARVEVAPYKRNPMDFVLWKPSTGDQPGWDSDWGYGRPGWHIECSAMARDLLGEKFDIHGGGLDLQFPHHENEIAQSKCACGEDSFAQVWMHNEMLQVEGKKMSKSLGNFFTVRDLLDKGIPGEVIRFVLLSTHYRKPMDFTNERIDEAERTLRRWRGMDNKDKSKSLPDQELLKILHDDLNTPGAISRLHELAATGDFSLLKASADILGLLSDKLGGWNKNRDLKISAQWALKEILKLRARAKEKRDFQTADSIRNSLQSYGITLKDLPDGTVQPKTDFFRVSEYFKSLTEDERRNILKEGAFSTSNSMDGDAMYSAYLVYVSEKVLEALK